MSLDRRPPPHQDLRIVHRDFQSTGAIESLRRFEYVSISRVLHTQTVFVEGKKNDDLVGRLIN